MRKMRATLIAALVIFGFLAYPQAMFRAYPVVTPTHYR